LTARNDEVTHLLAVLFANVVPFDARTKLSQYIDEACPGRIEIDVFEPQLRARQYGRGRDKERRGRNVPRYMIFDRMQLVQTFDGHDSGSAVIRQIGSMDAPSSFSINSV